MLLLVLHNDFSTNILIKKRIIKVYFYKPVACFIEKTEKLYKNFSVLYCKMPIDSVK